MKTKERWRNIIKTAIRHKNTLTPGWTGTVNLYMTGHEGEGLKVARKIIDARHVIKRNFVTVYDRVLHEHWGKGETEEMKIRVWFAAYHPIEKKEFDALNAKIAKLGYKFNWEAQS